MITSIQVAGQAVGVVSVPPSPGYRTVEWSVKDPVAMNVSPFTGVTQTYTWPGADQWMGTMTLPLLTQPQAAQWKAFLMECRGMANPFLLGDPLQPSPAGSLQRSVPVIDNAAAGANQPGMTTLAVKGLTPDAHRVLLPGDYLQVGYRMHMNLNPVTADSGGRAVLSVWPSLRELPVDGGTVVLKNVAGLFRRGSNTATWSATIGKVTSLSFQVVEYR